ncbi:hypothetical protein [Nonomuraea sp. SYSU D8015]|uniref:hypothetical protein n=1 Tax=Nonomuraea sp. SYSU D8015 TaxID=2593644 RepID=UPI001660CDDA|nr:hypothetical protein [Nonomuraea sp. SYSU D8015]
MPEVEIRPADSWDDVQTVFGPHGAYSGCWCMWFRVAGADQGDASRRPSCAPPGPRGGLWTGAWGLAYLDGTPVGWCAVAPREEHVRLRLALP